MPGQFRELLRQRSGRDALEGVDQPGQVGVGEDRMAVLRHETKWAYVVRLSHGPSRLLVCSSGTAIGWTRPRRSVRRSPAPSGAPGWSTTTGSGCVRTRTGPGCRSSGGGAVPTGRHARQADPATGVARGGLEVAVGVDLGLTSFAALSDGRKVDNPRWLRQRERALRRSQRNLSRKRKGSRNREKARLRTARLHARVADARRDFHHQFSTQVIGEHQTVCVETLNVAGLGRSRFAKSIHDAGWGQFTAMLE